MSSNYTFSRIEVYTEIYRQKYTWLLSTELEFNFYSPKCWEVSSESGLT